MNIFKILASGDGRINEPNVSAFLGFLLNPMADHGLGDELLKKILFNLYENNKESDLKDFLIDKYGVARNLSSYSNFNIEVLLEQAFTKDDKNKQVVDIVILCYEKKKPRKESLAKLVLSNVYRGDLKQIFLIENKIRKDAKHENQLKNQCEYTIETLKKFLGKSDLEVKKLMSVILISPDEDSLNFEYETFFNTSELAGIPKIQVHWDEEDEEGDSIRFFLQQLLKRESEGKIEAINDQTKFLLKSFLAFVQNGFRSTIEEELEGKMIRKIYTDFVIFKMEEQKLFSAVSWNLIEQFQNRVKNQYPDYLVLRYSPTHPVSIFVKKNQYEKVGKKIMSFTKTGKNIYIQLLYKNYLSIKNQNTDLKQFLLTFDNISERNIYDTNGIFHLRNVQFSAEDALKMLNNLYGILIKQNIKS